MSHYRGSRKHILEWRQSPLFLEQLNSLLEPTRVRVADASTVLPISRSHPTEARLETYGPRFLAETIDWKSVRTWWLRHGDGANTPNWDLAAVGKRAGKPVLVLVEAKANVPELGIAGKPMSRAASIKSMENDLQIRAAIDEAGKEWRQLDPHVHLSAASHYQLSNRLAFTWRLASLGLDVVLVFLGFTGDNGIADAGKPFSDEKHWQQAFWKHARLVVPHGVFERELTFDDGTAWLLLRSLPCLAVSPPRRYR